MDQAEFQQRQKDIHSDLAEGILGSIPEDWREAELTLGPGTSREDVESMSHELSNPLVTTGLVGAMPDDRVYAHTRRLELLFREFGAAWSKATFRLIWDDSSGEWRYTMDYEYET